MEAVAVRLPRLGKIELFFLLSFTCNHVVSVMRGFLFWSWDRLRYFIVALLRPAYNYFVDYKSLSKERNCENRHFSSFSIIIYGRNIIWVFVALTQTRLPKVTSHLKEKTLDKDFSLHVHRHGNRHNFPCFKSL